MGHQRGSVKTINYKIISSPIKVANTYFFGQRKHNVIVYIFFVVKHFVSLSYLKQNTLVID